MNEEIKYFSMFTGVGGFELGIERAYSNQQSTEKFQDGQRRNGDSNEKGGNVLSTTDTPLCIGFSEIDKYANQLLTKKFPNIPNFGDCTKIEADKLPNFDMLCGGFPCQSFSIAGKRRGFQDTRGTMFFHIARILEVKKPKLVFLENVKGLLNHNKGETFKVIIQTLSELGYDVQWMVLNSKFFGVPQNRERVFIIGSFRGTSKPEILPFREINQEVNRESKMITYPILSTELAHSTGRDFFRNGGKQILKAQIVMDINQAQRVYSTNGQSITLKGLGGGQGAKTGLYIVAMRGRNPNNPNDRTTGNPTEQRLEVNENGTSNNLTSVQKDNLVLEIANCLDANYWKGNSPSHRNQKRTRTEIINGMKIRRLTPTECERLQGFPDNWTEGFSDTQRYKMMGNAVTVNVIKAIANKLFVKDEEKAK